MRNLARLVPGNEDNWHKKSPFARKGQILNVWRYIVLLKVRLGL